MSRLRKTVYRAAIMACFILLFQDAVLAAQIKLVDGNTLSCRVVRADSECLTVIVNGIELKVKYDYVDTEDALKLRKEWCGENGGADDFFKLGEWCLSIDLEPEAEGAFQRARRKDPLLGDKAKEALLAYRKAKEAGDTGAEQIAKREARKKRLAGYYEKSLSHFNNKKYKKALWYLRKLQAEKDRKLLAEILADTETGTLEAFEALVTECEGLEKDPDYRKRFSWEKASEHVSRHYFVRTNTGIDAAKEIAGRMEEVFKTYAKVLKLAPVVSEQMKIYVFRKEEEYKKYADDNRGNASARAYYSSDNDELVTYLSESGDPAAKDELFRACFAEGAIQYLDACVVELPAPWFLRGAAIFFRSAYVKGSRPEIGQVNAYVAERLLKAKRLGNLISLPELIAHEGDLSTVLAYQAWGFIHFLVVADKGKNYKAFQTYLWQMKEGDDRPDGRFDWSGDCIRKVLGLDSVQIRGKIEEAFSAHIENLLNGAEAGKQERKDE